VCIVKGADAGIGMHKKTKPSLGKTKKNSEEDEKINKGGGGTGLQN